MRRPFFQTPQGGNRDLHMNGYGVVLTFENRQPTFPTSQGRNPNNGLNGYATASTSGQRQSALSLHKDEIQIMV